jgi:hypothetical protein
MVQILRSLALSAFTSHAIMAMVAYVPPPGSIKHDAETFIVNIPIPPPDVGPPNVPPGTNIGPRPKTSEPIGVTPNTPNTPDMPDMPDTPNTPNTPDSTSSSPSIQLSGFRMICNTVLVIALMV